ncbi:MAG TPA: hypothetical protein VM733_06285, partial [Thermoanaerobaculia bacterium]|nr:hypothetical protein [Thermoanaerobaculia bacterium]
TSAGPTNINGRVISIAIDPKEPLNVYAGTVGGLWRSQTGGRRWQRVSDEIPKGAQRFSAVAVNPVKTEEIFAGTGDRNVTIWDKGNGLWMSTAHGAPGTWTPLGNFDNQIIYRIRIDPDPNSNDVWVAATSGVWRGKRDNNTGAVVFDKPYKDFTRLTHDLVIDFSETPRILYAGVRTNFNDLSQPVGIWKTDTGPFTIWSKKDSGIDLSDAETFSLALAKSKPSILYARVSHLTGGGLVGLYKTTTAAEAVNGDPAWFKLPVSVGNGLLKDEGMLWFNTLLEVDPTDSKRVFAGGMNMWMSVDGGYKWDNLSPGKDLDFHYEAHSDFHTLAFDPKNPKIFFVGNDGGIDRADLTNPDWHWVDSSHGMVISMFNYMASNRRYPTLVAGGLQDNGNIITYGNRTWYQPGGGDGFDVGSDAGNPNTLYGSYNWGANINLQELVNPIPGLPGGPIPPWDFGSAKIVAWNLPAPDIMLRPPMITDMDKPKSALTGGGPEPCGPRSIYKTTDNKNWVDTLPGIEEGGNIVELASAPSSLQFNTHLAAIAYQTLPGCGAAGTAFDPYVIRTTNGGPWTKVTGLPPKLVPTSLSFDPNDASRSYVTYIGDKRVYMSVNNGTYMPIGVGLPANVRKVIADPSDPNVLYAATSVGVMRGVVTPGATPSATWNAFDEGLPDGMEINELWADPQTGILTLGSFGYGVFRRDIRKGILCPARMLVVRDSTYDDGREPSVAVADAENPLPDGEFYKPNNTMGGKAWWWKSRDIRIDVPSSDPHAHMIEDADHVEFESCPTPLAACMPGTMIDSPPEAFKAARVYVQVTNRGVEPVADTRVIALWNPNAGAIEALPDTFWTQTFPAGAGCGPLDPTTNWQLVDPEKPCRTIDKVTPIMPEVARFDWTPPLGAEGGATMLTIVEAPGDLLEESIRKENKLVPKDIVRASRHIALRNVQIHPFDAGVREPFLWPLDLLKLPSDILKELEVVVSKPELRESIRIVLPAGLAARPGLGSARPTRVTEPELVRKLEAMRLDPDNAWELSGDEASLFVSLRPGQRVNTAVIAAPADANGVSRVSFLTRSGDEVMGGSELLMRPRAR